MAGDHDRHGRPSETCSGETTVSITRVHPRSWPMRLVEILGRPAGTDTGRTVLDVEILREAGISDFSQYGGQSPLAIDIFVDAPIP